MCSIKLRPTVIVLSISLIIFSCTKDNSNEIIENNGIQINWNNYPDGTYSETQARKDFGNISNWNDLRASIKNGALKISISENSLSSGGIIAKWDIENASSYEISYDILFDSNFEWSKGGKCGFGLQLGDGNTGGDPAWDGNGGSMRMM